MYLLAHYYALTRIIKHSIYINFSEQIVTIAFEKLIKMNVYNKISIHRRSFYPFLIIYYPEFILLKLKNVCPIGDIGSDARVSVYEFKGDQ